MKNTTYKATDDVFSMGLLLLCATSIVFCFPFILQANEGLFLVNLLFTGIYFLALLVHGKLRKGRMGLYAMFVFLTIFLISAYALNREMEVFKSTTTWLAIALIISCANLILFAYREKISPILQNMMCFVLGISFVIFGYLAIYLIPLYALSLIGAIFLGISLHSFVPLLFCIYIIILIDKLSTSSKKLVPYFWGGFASALFVLLIYLTAWGFTLKTLKNATHTDLPNWVAKAQKVKPGFMTERVLKTELSYSVPDDDFSNIFWSTPRRNFEEAIKHDPLVTAAAVIAGKPNIDETDKVKILNTIYDARYNQEERYWTGRDLTTNKVETAIEIWPDMRLAYTEMQLEVFNTSKQRWGDGQQEAIYTFYLPEGSVVTSLSLWIDGKEEKAILTTKSKAATAYKTIVGVEVRDPSVVHWQEGNKVSVRVFPVFKNDSRQFKIGITSPLSVNNDQLQYQPVYFDGPPSITAKESVNISFASAPKNLQLAGFKKENNLYKRKGKYNADWTMRMDKTDLNQASFGFGNSTYKIMPVGNILETANITDVYLDINATWTEKDFDHVLTTVKNKPIFVANEEQDFLTVQKENKAQVFKALSKNSFSLFPFQKITNPENALVITKSGALSPTLDELKETKFLQALKQNFSNGHRIRLFNIGEALNPYLKTLKEFRAFYYAKGDISRLNELISTQRFPTGREAQNQVIIDAADMMIEANSIAIEKNTAPDHVMRLYAYNNILKNNGTALLTDHDLEELVLEEAQTAYVVSPVSSLIVLETQKDYDKFNIEDSKNGLKNASLNSKGAVPEPHEWAVIILVALLFIYIAWKKRVALKLNK